MIAPTTTVRQVVGRHPQTRRVFEKYGIDYCCGGKLCLTDAAKEVRADPQALVGDLETALKKPPDAQKPEEKDWYASALSELVRHILDVHHVYMHGALPRVRQLMAKVLRAHGPKHGDILQPAARLAAGLDQELAAHLEKEERVLFPHILDMAAAAESGTAMPPFHCGSVAESIRRMQHEHESAGAVLDELRRLTGGYALPADACPTFAALYEELLRMEADLHQHIHLENNILFPRVLDLNG